VLSLFPIDPKTNILPYNGEVYYHEEVIEKSLQEVYFNQLLKEIDWQQDELIMFGKKITTAREVAWYAAENYSYTYSNTVKVAQPWTPTLLKIKELVESVTQSKYNSCLLNLYHHGGEGMGWHADDEIELVKNSSIASVSLGASRKFAFKHQRSNEKRELILYSGSILDMKGEIQQFWKHSLPKSKKVHSARINLTFRLFRT